MDTTACTVPLQTPRALPIPWVTLGTVVVTPAQAAVVGSHVMLARLAVGVGWLLRGWPAAPRASMESAR